MTLSEFFSHHPRAALGLSGGVDSACLLAAALACGAEVRPYFVKTAFQPEFELEDARALCQMLGVELTVLEGDVLSCPQVTENSPRRCYFCKRLIFGLLARQAARDGFSLLLDGTNASDDAGDRPGMQALRELSVRSPLRECGLTKAEIRRMAREAGLPCWGKPAYACLATRIPTGEAITARKLEITQKYEAYLMTFGLRDFRIRWHHGCARIQVAGEELPLLLEHREAILTALGRDYEAVLLDLEVRP